MLGWGIPLSSAAPAVATRAAWSNARSCRLADGSIYDAPMALTDQIQSDLTAAMKARDADTVGTLRMVMAAVKNQRVAAGQSGDVTDDQMLELLTREAKKRTEAAEAYDNAGRPELAEKERSELGIIRRYLPEQLDEETLRTYVDEAIAESGATSPSDLGKVMSAVMPKVKGRADGKVINALVRERLTG